MAVKIRNIYNLGLLECDRILYRISQILTEMRLKCHTNKIAKLMYIFEIDNEKLVKSLFFVNN